MIDVLFQRSAAVPCRCVISGILADENADGPRALFIAGSDGRISRAWLPEAGHDGVKDIAQVVAAVERSASEASVALHCLIHLILVRFFQNHSFTPKHSTVWYLGRSYTR